MMTRHNILAVVAAAALLAGCGDPSGSERFDPVGTLSFSYQGAISGTFQATGEMEVDEGAAPTPQTGATAYLDQEQVALLAFQAKGATRGDAFALLLGDAETGTLALNPAACQQQAAPDCRVGVFLPDVDVTQVPTGEDPGRVTANTFILAIGSVKVTSRSRVRIKGTFSGVALRASDPSPLNAINITGGTFDLPIRPE